MQRRRFKQSDPLDQRLTKEVVRLRKEAEGISPGARRDKLIREARYLEEASHMQAWLSSRGSQTPE